MAAIAFSINSGAYIGEIIRGGIESVDKGQMEAARSLGFSRWQAMRLVILPQALKNSLPALISEFIALLKETSVVGWIGLNDIMRGADNIRFQTATVIVCRSGDVLGVDRDIYPCDDASGEEIERWQ